MFTTPVATPQYSFKIDYSKRGLILGSCFAQEIGTKLLEAKLPVELNPHGVLFNPASIGRAYSDLTADRKYLVEDLVQHGGLWHSMHHHGSFSAPNPEEVLDKINKTTTPKIDYIIVTLGTAWVYEYSGEIVANCHKIPASEFVRLRLSVEECVESLSPIAESGLPVILTVSPVRHIKDGLSENSLSKSILRVAVTELCEKYTNVCYFPSFEIVVDELRDYRYYADDMLHPSKVAIDYIWDKFSSAFFERETKELVGKIAKLRAALQHRPLHPDSVEYQKFKEATQTAIRKISTEHPEIDFSEELISG